MKKLFLGAVGFALFLLAVLCWVNVKPVSGAGKPVAEIKSVAGPRNSANLNCTLITALIKNNTSERVKGINLVLHGYDKQKKKIFEEGGVFYSCSDRRVSRWRQSDRSIREKDTVPLMCGLPDDQLLYSKEFKEEYGEPKYFVVELYVEGELIDVMAKPKRFFKHSTESEREKRLKEWEEIK